MTVSQAILNRKSCRAFLETPVEKDLIFKLLDWARWAPSSVNHQPAQVAVVTGETKKRLSRILVEKFSSGVQPNPDYPSAPKWRDPYLQRRQECSLAMYRALNINLEDELKKNKHRERNYSFFEAPVGLIVFLDKEMPKGSWTDTGMFIQNLLLGAHELGLATCSQGSIAKYPDAVREVLGLTHVDIVCGIALGYEDREHPLNSYRTEREPVSAFSRWYD